MFEHIAPGSILFADSAKAYIAPAKARGLWLSCVDHGKGEYTRKEIFRGQLRTISGASVEHGDRWSMGIGGAWGNLKIWLAAEGLPRSAPSGSSIQACPRGSSKMTEDRKDLHQQGRQTVTQERCKVAAFLFIVLGTHTQAL